MIGFGRGHRLAVVLMAVLGLAAGSGRLQTAARAADEPTARGTGFRAILEQRQREALRAVADYIAQHPDADDLDAAHAWMFETASAIGLEADVVPAAQQLLKRRDLDSSLRLISQATLCIGLARGGKLDDAVVEFEASLPAARFQSPFRTLDLAGALAAQARIAGKLNVSREVYERVAAAYPLNAQIGEIVEGRLARQELIGKPVPQFSARDVQGNEFSMAALSGKVVLVDFWGTTCAPCLAEFPNLKELYRQHHSNGFEIVGLSFDESPAVVESFQQRARLPWRLMMNGMISESFRTRTIPALFLVDRKGQIAQVDVRGVDLRNVVESLLKDETR